MRREEILKKFMWGLSILNSYIEYNGKLNLHDINIFAETMMCDLLNILFDLGLKNANSNRLNNPIYDLISRKNSYIVQVSATKEPAKIIDTLSSLDNEIKQRKKNEQELYLLKEEKQKNIASYTLEVQKKEKILESALHNTVDISGYNIIFMILTKNTAKQRKYKGKEGKGYIIPETIVFDQCKNIWDFDFLINKVSSVSEIGEEDILTELEIFMNKYNHIFIKRENLIYKEDNVSEIINEYADNFNEKLFRHRYIEESNVKLCNLYVDPIFKISQEKQTENIVEILDSFLWNDAMCRILFVEGDAAVGKTSWVSWLCYHYRELDEIGKSIFLDKRIVCIRLRELEFLGKSISPEKSILDYLKIDSLEDFNRKYGECIMILDGADEISMVRNWLNTTIEGFINNIRQIFNRNKLIITSRPKFINIEKFNARNYNVKCIEMLHFDYKKRIEWIEKYEKCGETVAENTKLYIENMDEKVAYGVADTPLALYLLSACDMKEELQGNAWALYNEIFRNAIINTEYNENFRAISEHPIVEKKEVIYEIVCDIAFKMFQNSKEERYYVIGQEVIDIINARDLDNNEREWAKQCCVLCAYWKSDTDIGALEFYHNNIRDYFFCEYILKKLNGCCDYEGKIDIEEYIKIMCKIMQYGCISGTTWEQSFSFIYMRLRYELTYCERYERSAITTVDFESRIPELVSDLILYRKTLWEYDYKELNYQSMKNTLFNTLLLLRICQEACGCSSNDKGLIRMWRGEEIRKINNLKLFKEWAYLFSGGVKVSDDIYIGVGKNCVLEKLDLESTYLNEINFSYSNLNHACLKNTKLQKTSFQHANLQYTNFEGADLENANFSFADLSYANLSGANIDGAIFEGAILNNTKFDGVKIEWADFTSTRITGVDWGTQNLKDVCIDFANFTNCNLKSIKKKKSSINNVNFTDCNMERCDFSESVLKDITYTNTRMQNANLRGSIVQKGILQDLRIDNANMRNSRLIDMHFKNIKAIGTAFSQTYIDNCSFEGENDFNRADFRRAKIDKDTIISLKLQGADLRFISGDEEK